MTPTPQKFVEAGKSLGEHIFRWGLSCEDCTPEDFKIEMAKAVKQVILALQTSHDEGFVEGVKSLDKQPNK